MATGVKSTWGQAMRYLFTDREEAATTILVGGMFTFFTFLLIPQIILLGYFIQVLRGTTQGTMTPPRFDEWSRFLIDGSRAFVIWFLWITFPIVVVYMVHRGEMQEGQATVMLVGAMTGAPMVLSAVTGGLSSVVLPLYIEQYGFTEPYILFVLVLYFFPASLFCYLEHGTFRAAFSAKHLNPILRNKRYLVAWIGFAVFWFLAEIPLRVWTYGVFLVPVAFYLKVTAWVLIAQAYPMATRRDEPPSANHQSRLDGFQTRSSSPIARPEADRSPTMTIAGVPLKIYLAGGFLMSLSIYVVPGIVAVGYLMRAIRSQTDHMDPPSFAWFRDLLLDGLRAYVVWLVYLLIPVSLMAFTVLQGAEPASAHASLATWGLVSGIGIPGGYPAVVLFLVGSYGILFLLEFVLSLIPLDSVAILINATILSVPLPIAVGVFLGSLYVLPAAIRNVALSESLRPSVARRTLLHPIRSRSYPLQWVTIMVLTLPGWIVLFWAYVTLIPQLLVLIPATPIVQLVSLAGYFERVLVPLPASIASLRAVVVWAFLLSAGVLYFALLLASSRVISRM